MEPSSVNSQTGLPSGRRPVAAANTVSPSSAVCAGWIARASPSCAITANCLACALVSVASVATMAIVVFSPGPPLATGIEGRRRRHCHRKSEPAELAVLLERRRPELALVPDVDAAAGVDRDQRPDGVAAARHCRGRAEPALEIDRGCAMARARGAEREIRPRRGSRGVAELAVGRIPPSACRRR